MSSLNKLFEPGKIGSLEIKNRIVMPAMSSHGAAEDGAVTETMIDYYEARAKGGVGLITVGSLCVDYPIGTSGMPRPAIDKDKLIPGFSQLVGALHKHGAKAAAQIHHAGPAHRSDITGLQPVAASAIIRPVDVFRPVFFQPKELSVSEIGDIIDHFARAAERAQKAGFDGIEIHGAHRYLINSFLSPYFNKRQDKYGGDLRDRARFLLEIISAIREVVGRDFPLWCKINARETIMKGGITLEQTKELAPMLEKAGLDAILTSVYLDVQMCPPGFNMDAAAEVKKVVSIPVIAVGRISPELGERLLRLKKADFIAMARGLLSDPELPNKAASGRLDDIAPCLYCNNCMLMATGYHDFQCTVNAALNKEREYAIKPAEKTKKVLVVGGGPAGMEAARIAALRGHQVLLYEKERRLGGQLTLASMLREEDIDLVKYLSTQVKRAGVKVELGKEVTPALIAEIKPDAMVLATGATSALPEIPGINRDNVLSGADVQEILTKGRLRRVEGKKKLSWRMVLWNLGCILVRVPFGSSVMRWVLRFWVPLGKRVIVVGRGLPGVELADFLTERGKRVTIVDTREDLPYEEPPMPMLRHFLESRLVENGVAMLTGVECEEITNKGLIIISKNGLRQTIKGDTIMFAADYRPNDGLSKVLAGMPYEVHLVGDCAQPCGILEAIRDGSRVGNTV